MKLRSTLILLGAVIAAGIVAYALSRAPAGGGRLLPALRAGTINSITIEHGSQRIAFGRRDGEWRLVKPLKARADADRIARILAGFAAARAESRIEAPAEAELGQYGLKPPERTVWLIGNVGVIDLAIHVDFGAALPVGDLVYVRVSGRDGIYAVPASLARSVDVTAADLRSKLLAPPIAPAELQALAISGAALDGMPGFALQCRRSGDRWELAAPVSDAADAALVALLAETISAHRAVPEDFVPGSPADYGLYSPALTVTLSAAERTETLRFSRRADGCYALLQGESAPVRVPAELFDTLRRPPTDLRDRALMHVEARDVAGIELAGPQGTLTLARKGAGWEIPGERPAAADAATVADLLAAIGSARAAQFAADAPADLSAWGLSEGARTRVLLRGAGERTLAELALGRSPQTGDVYAMRLPYPAVLLLAEDPRLASVFADRGEFLDRTVLREPAAEAVQIELRNAAGSSRAALDEAAGEWVLLEPVRGEADAMAVQDILSDFSDLRAEAPPTESVAEPGAPQASVTVTYRAAEGAGRARTLRIGTPAAQPAGSFQATVDGDARAFVLADGVVDHLRRGLASRAICGTLGPIGLTFRAGERSAEFRYDPARSAWADAEGNPLPEPTAGALLNALALLRRFEGRAVADYVEKSPALYGFDAPYLEVDLTEPDVSGKRIVIGKPADGGGRYAKGPATGFVLIADDADVATLRAVLGPL